MTDSLDVSLDLATVYALLQELRSVLGVDTLTATLATPHGIVAVVADDTLHVRVFVDDEEVPRTEAT